MQARGRWLCCGLAAVAAWAGLAPATPLDLDTSPAALAGRYAPESPAPTTYPAYFNAVDRARAQIAGGACRRALYTLAGSASPDALVLRARAHAALGETAEAWAVLNSPALLRFPDAAVERSLLHGAAGDDLAALGDLEGLPPSWAVRARRAALQIALGEQDAARLTLTPFAEELPFWQGGRADDRYGSAAEALAVGRGLDAWATLGGQYRDKPALSQAILSIFTRTYDVLDRDSVEAHFAAAEYLARHDDAAGAGKELEAVLARNPRHAGALVLAGQLALEQYDFARAEAAIAAIRGACPGSADADLLEARTLLAGRRADAAIGLLARLAGARPRDLHVLGLLAAAHAIRLDDAGAAQALQQADAAAPGSGTAGLELARQLDALRQYPRAAERYAGVLAREPWNAPARTSLGLLHMQSGDEAAARATLEEARHLDPFNARATNCLRLLDRMAGMATLETPHFTIRSDSTADPFIAEMAAEVLEPTHAELAGRYHFDPAEKTLIEFFPTHAQFSVRTAGIPFIGTVGASTGRVIALVTPRDAPTALGTYNFAQVLRHEYTHTITLGATDNRIPHWLTEGLAVLSEDTPLRWEWIPLLARASRDGFFSLDALTWAFINPAKPSDRQLAYAQSAWIAQYLEETAGHDAVLRLLAAFKSGQSEEAAFQSVFGKSRAELLAAFTAYAKGELAAWGHTPAAEAQYASVKAEAESALARKDLAAALPLWLQLATLRPNEALAHQRLAGLYLAATPPDYAHARVDLEKLTRLEIKDNRYAKRLASLCLTMDDLVAAERYARQATYTNPQDPDGHKLLLTIETRLGDAEAAARESARIAALGTPAARDASSQPIPTPIDPG